MNEGFHGPCLPVVLPWKSGDASGVPLKRETYQYFGARVRFHLDVSQYNVIRTIIILNSTSRYGNSGTQQSARGDFIGSKEFDGDRSITSGGRSHSRR